MRRPVLVLWIAAAILVGAGAASASPILPAGSNWEYTFTDPTGDASWNTTTGGWQVGPAPFGNNVGGIYDPGGYFDWATYWPADSWTPDGNDLWVRTSFSTTGFDLNSISWNLGVDNGFELYLNGHLIAGTCAEGYTYRWEYSGSFAGSPYLNSGTNVVAVALEDHGMLTAFDMEVVGRPVPDSGMTFLLLGLSLATMASFRRCHRRD